MRCHEVLDQLPLLIYDELTESEVANCRAHLAGCAACSAEFASLVGVHRLLDGVPDRQVQIDLAAICLHVVQRQRHDRIVRRAVIATTAAAACLFFVVGFCSVKVAFEPGRVVVAWKKSNAALPLVPGVVESPESQLAHDTESMATTAAPRATSLLEDLASERYSDLAVIGSGRRPEVTPGQAAALRYSQPLSAHAMPAPTPASYNDLRRELLNRAPGSAEKLAIPGA